MEKETTFKSLRGSFDTLGYCASHRTRVIFSEFVSSDTRGVIFFSLLTDKLHKILACCRTVLAKEQRAAATYRSSRPQHGGFREAPPIDGRQYFEIGLLPQCLDLHTLILAVRGRFRVSF